MPMLMILPHKWATWQLLTLSLLVLITPRASRFGIGTQKMQILSLSTSSACLSLKTATGLRCPQMEKNSSTTMEPPIGTLTASISSLKSKQRGMIFPRLESKGGATKKAKDKNFWGQPQVVMLPFPCNSHFNIVFNTIPLGKVTDRTGKEHSQFVQIVKCLLVGIKKPIKKMSKGKKNVANVANVAAPENLYDSNDDAAAINNTSMSHWIYK